MPDLIALLQKEQGARGYTVFPSDANYYDLYIRAREWLSTNVLSKTALCVACGGDGFYTDHGIAHCDAIIRAACRFLDYIHDEKKQLSPYEIYLFLMSILMHDAGMIHGRENHGANCRKIGADMHNLLPDNGFEQRIIYGIAASHEGRTVLGSRDTVGCLETKSRLNNIVFRPALLGALLRFFDEISEDRTRAAGYCLQNGIIPEESVIHHAYANSIQSVSYADTGVEIVYYMKDSDLENKIPLYYEGSVKNEYYLFDWICTKIAKINRERQYCSRYMWGFLQIEKIVARVHIHNNQYDELKTVNIFGKDRFPLDVAAFHDIEVEYDGAALRKEILHGT